MVGYSGTFSGFRAFVSSDDGVLQDLNNLIPLGSGFTLDSAYAINDKGEIVGIGFINGQQHGFLLRPAASSCEGANVNGDGTVGDREHQDQNCDDGAHG